jgi:PIN domain nuclease of toxin-antitoxin system
MRLLLDTHALIWLLSDSRHISGPVYAQMEKATDRDELFVSAITPWEIAMLVAKGRLRLNRDVGDWIASALALPGIQLESLSPAIAVASTRLPWLAHPDPADRILLATARHLNATLVTADRQLLTYGNEGHVRCMAPS